MPKPRTTRYLFRVGIEPATRNAEGQLKTIPSNALRLKWKVKFQLHLSNAQHFEKIRSSIALNKIFIRPLFFVVITCKILSFLRLNIWVKLPKHLTIEQKTKNIPKLIIPKQYH